MKIKMVDRRVLVKQHAKEYRRANKKEKGLILDVFVKVTGYERVYAARLLRKHGKKIQIAPGVILQADVCHKGLGGRPRKYGPEVEEPLKLIYSFLDHSCGKRLKFGIPGALDSLERFSEINLTPDVREKLLAMSPATLDRILKPERQKWALKNRGGTKPGTLLKSQIPVRIFSEWDENRPGFVEIDLVEHNGGSTRGDYTRTLDITDIYSGWTEPIALLNKAHRWVLEGLDMVRKRLPFELLGIDSDNGSEFINAALVKYCETNSISFTRARPGRKNDNCFVEQKNYSIVRRAAGHGRLVGSSAVHQLNRLYTAIRLRCNFFLPSQKLVFKQRHGSRVTKHHDKARTPYQRLLDSEHVENSIKTSLENQFKQLNLAQINRDITEAQKILEKMLKRPTQEIVRLDPPVKSIRSILRKQSS